MARKLYIFHSQSIRSHSFFRFIYIYRINWCTLMLLIVYCIVKMTAFKLWIHICVCLIRMFCKLYRFLSMFVFSYFFHYQISSCSSSSFFESMWVCFSSKYVYIYVIFFISCTDFSLSSLNKQFQYRWIELKCYFVPEKKSFFFSLLFASKIFLLLFFLK